MRRLSRFRAWALVALVFVPAAVRAGDVHPYNGSFQLTITGLKVLPTSETQITGLLSEGQVTFLSRFDGEVEYLVEPGGSFTGTATKVAANGDTLKEALAGSLTPLDSVGTFTLTGGTGRFANASGGGAFLSAWTGAVTAAVQFTGSASTDASAGRDPLLKPLSFHVSGDGVFDPANTGTRQGGNAGLVIGDGSGLAPYTASGTDFVLDGFDLGKLGLGRVRPRIDVAELVW